MNNTYICTMQFTAKQIAELLNGSVEGNPDAVVNRLSKIEEGAVGSLSFLSNPKYESYLYSTRASVVIVNEDLQPTDTFTATLIRVPNAYSAFSVLLEKYEEMRKASKTGIEQPSFVDASATVGKNAYIGAFAYIGANAKIGDNVKIYPHAYIGDNVTVGNNSTIYPSVSIYYDCRIGNDVIIHSGAVIGSDGFGFAPQADGSYHKISQIGNVVIEDNVEIGANTCIDRATIIRKGVKLDNLIQLAHNVEVGENTVIASQTGVSGSAKVGENAIIGGQVGIVGHITIAKGSQIQAKSGINKSLEEEGKKWAGAPASSYNAHMRAQVVLSRLPELERKIEELERLLEEKKTI